MDNGYWLIRTTILKNSHTFSLFIGLTPQFFWHMATDKRTCTRTHVHAHVPNNFWTSFNSHVLSWHQHMSYEANISVITHLFQIWPPSHGANILHIIVGNFVILCISSTKIYMWSFLWKECSISTRWSCILNLGMLQVNCSITFRVDHCKKSILACENGSMHKQNAIMPWL